MLTVLAEYINEAKVEDIGKENTRGEIVEKEEQIQKDVESASN